MFVQIQKKTLVVDLTKQRNDDSKKQKQQCE